MASLEDVKRYALQHAYEDRDALEARIAKEFEMSREEASRVLRDLADESVELENPQPAPNIGAVAALGVPGGTLTGAPAAAAVATEELAREKEATRTDPNRD